MQFPNAIILIIPIAIGINLIALILWSARELVVYWRLRQASVTVDAEIIDRYTRRGSRSGPAFWIRYSFRDPQGFYYTRQQPIGGRNYDIWHKGDSIQIRFLADSPRISRLADNDTPRQLLLLGAGSAVITLFPVYFFGWSTIPIIIGAWIVLVFLNFLLLARVQ